MNYELNPPIQARGFISGEKHIILAISDNMDFTIVYHEEPNKGKLRNVSGKDLILTLPNTLLRGTLVRSGEKMAILAFLPYEKVIAAYKDGANAGRANIFSFSELLLDDFFWPDVHARLEYGEHPQDA